MSIPVLNISKLWIREINEILQKLHEQTFDFGNCTIDDDILQRFRLEILQTKFCSTLMQEVGSFSDQVSKGYLILDLGEDFDLNNKLKEFLTILLCGILRPFGVFSKHGLYREIHVDLNKETNRSNGTGYNPFHIDFVNTTSPPQYSILFCVQEDPNGGGQTIVSNFHKVMEVLNRDEIELLKQKVFTEGKYFELSNVGDELLPFPIVQFDSNKDVLLRYTAKINSQGNFNYLIKKIEKLLIERQEVFLLKKNQLVIFNQRIVCHGRLPVNGDQEIIPATNRRLLLQIFGKDYESHL